MKKKQLLFLLMAYALSVTQIFAQENIEKQSRFDNAPEPQRRRWQVTIEIDKLVKAIQGQQTLYGLTLTKYSMNKTRKSAVRYSFYGYGSNIDYGRINTDNNSNLALSTGISYENQHQWGRFMLFYGPGIGIGYNRSAANFGDNGLNVKFYKKVVNDLNINTGLYYGARFFINSRLSLNIMSGVTATYLNKNNNEVITQDFGRTVFSDTTIKESNITINTSQVNLGLGIHF
jgi:hypothetical protein